MSKGRNNGIIEKEGEVIERNDRAEQENDDDDEDDDDDDDDDDSIAIVSEKTKLRHEQYLANNQEEAIMNRSRGEISHSIERLSS